MAASGRPTACRGCGAGLGAGHGNRRYCSGRCRRTSYQRAYAERFAEALGVHFTTYYWRVRHPGRARRV